MKTRSIGGILFLCAAVSLAGDPDDAKRSDEADKTAKQLQELQLTSLPLRLRMVAARNKCVTGAVGAPIKDQR